MTAKLERLRQLSQHPEFAVLVPPLAALPTDGLAAETEWTQGQALLAVCAERAAGRGDWLEHVKSVCGPAPWIIRSAGLEDGEHFVNAGGYASLVCRSEAEFANTIAAVALSGFAAQAVEQQRLADPAYRPRPIACFAQPLIESGDDRVDMERAPYLSAADCAGLLGTLAALHRHFAFEALDTEWVLETDQGMVSVTGLTLAGVDGVRGQLAFGYGFASAQSPGLRANSVAYCWPSLAAPLWQGERLLMARIRKTWLVQVRPAPGYALERRVRRLTAAARGQLSQRLREVRAVPVLQPAAPRQGGFLAAATLDDAWSRYLRLAPEARAELAAVFVESGVASEHAGIMFRQQRLPVFRVELAALPAVSGVVVDAVGERAWFGTVTPSLEPETEEADCVDLPAGVRCWFDDEAPALDGPDAERAQARLRMALAGLPAAAEHDRAAIEQRSAWPSSSWLECDGGVRSPSLLGWLLSHDRAALQAWRSNWETVPEAVAYVHAEHACRDPRAELPVLCRECPSLATSLPSVRDIRLAMALSGAERWAARLPGTRLAALAGTALENPAAREQLECVLRVLDDTGVMPIYDDEDRIAIVGALCAAVDHGIAPADLWRAVRRGQLAPTALASLVASPRAFAAYLELLGPLETFRAAAALAGGNEAAALLEASSALTRVLRENGLSTLEGLCRIDQVDTWDQVLKAVLTDVVERRDPAAHRRYLDLLAGWIGFARLQGISASDDAALAVFLEWLALAREAPVPDAFLLELEEEEAERLGDEFLRWQVLMPIAGSGGVEALPMQNAHQLHNLLHQWMLARFRAEAGAELPGCLRQLLTIADGFGDARSCLLRLGRSVLEISLPMVVHKASFLFDDRELTVEFAELPDAPEEEIGRLLVFEALARRIGEWEPAWRVSLNRVCVLGTWTLFLRVRRSDDERLRAGDVRQMLIWLRVLFDTAYDFSYVDNEEVEEAYALFGESPWPDLFRFYADYREAIDFSMQRATVYALPFATTLASVCQDEAVREAVADAYLSGFEGAWQAFLDTCAELEQPDEDVGDWSSRYAAAGQLGLLLAAVWPRQALARLAQAPVSDIAGERIGASLLHRRDLAGELRRLIAPGAAPAGAALRALALSRAPCRVVEAATAIEIGEEVARAGRAFKRCKEYLLAHHADLLPERVCERLIAQLDLVPRGVTPAAEASIGRALERAAERRARFHLAEVDYVAIVRAFSTEITA
ncbi:hypothetical protein [Paludibacterium paludis]|uniref:Uncharacterized protein n=1 Tax=Paludibacterium paludis TaxID=1225769 RepID=A0A918P653_9NEIS|nr:hypothetical protein [Paludibacterium paludis]GGY24661.1 hypothetical protein GCM10011289_30350 [Paludibacterium paludis]